MATSSHFHVPLKSRSSDSFRSVETLAGGKRRSMNAAATLVGGRFRPQATDAARPGTRILIVDDALDLLDMLMAYFPCIQI